MGSSNVVGNCDYLSNSAYTFFATSATTPLADACIADQDTPSVPSTPTPGWRWSSRLSINTATAHLSGGGSPRRVSLVGRGRWAFPSLSSMLRNLCIPETDDERIRNDAFTFQQPTSQRKRGIVRSKMNLRLTDRPRTAIPTGVCQHRVR